ncbi:hypothetical protein Fot_14571 [Forsythia ovata]|uniref:Uncharacterized protein n=1 Tax=Forsythia ovata TaxID=205694 RepID=A0ABD1W6Q2_9LAMI
MFYTKINFTKPKKNPTPASTPKVVQTKISLKTKSPSLVKEVVIKEPSPNFVRPTQVEVSGKDKEKAVEPPPKVKSTSKLVPSVSKIAQLGSSSGEKRSSSDRRSRPAKKLRTGVSSGPPLVDLFRTRPEGLHPSTARSHLSENYLARAFILVQDQNRLYKELSATMEKYVVEVEEYKKKVNDYCSITELLEAKVERRTNELEDLRKNPEAERLKVDVRDLVNDLAATRARAQEKDDKLHKEIEKKREDKLILYATDVLGRGFGLER